MDSHKIAFIVCVNNAQEFAEACYYISRLEVPDSYQIDIIEVWETSSMASGYNEAMERSDAKYKIYMHQDTFIIYQNFIVDMLRIFETDRQIGMFGCVGCDDLPGNAQAVTAWNVGTVYHNCTPGRMERRQNEDKSPVVVEALDGLILATQYDIRWREDLFDGWDFYDVSQCFEMKRAGYKVVVPFQETPWCYHDNTYSKMVRYQEYCHRLISEYQDIKPFYAAEYSREKQEFDLLKEESRWEVQELVKAGDKEELIRIFSCQENQGYLHLREFEALANIVHLERRDGRERFWENGLDYQALMEKMAILRFAVKRIEYAACDIEEEEKYLSEIYSSQAVSVMRYFYVEPDHKIG